MPKNIDSKKDEMTRAKTGISYVGDLLAREVPGKLKELDRKKETIAKGKG